MVAGAYVVVGAFARVDACRCAQVRSDLDALEGVTTFPLDEPGKLGLLVDAAGIDAAHAVLTGPVRAVAGVLGVWPVSVHVNEDVDDAVVAAQQRGAIG